MWIAHFRNTFIMIAFALILAMASCSEKHEHTAPAIREQDSVAVMTTYGVNTLVSDSGVIKYRIVAEEWEVNENKNPSRWTFNKGLLLTQFDLKKHVVGFIQCDTAVYYDKDRIWKLNGRVKILTAQGVHFYSNELSWDEQNHKIWSYSYSYLKAPDKELEGNWFTSDEQMMNYEIRQTRGWSILKKNEFMPTAGQSPMSDQSQLTLDTLAQKDLRGSILKR